MPRRVLQGKVINNKNHKTVLVLVERRVKHPLYKKYIRRSKKYAAHDEDNLYHIGDSVMIQEHRPISKQKRWKVIGYLSDISRSSVTKTKNSVHDSVHDGERS